MDDKEHAEGMETAPGLSTVRPYSMDGSFDAGAVSAVIPFYGLERPVYLLGPGAWTGRRGRRFHIRSG